MAPRPVPHEAGAVRPERIAEAAGACVGIDRRDGIDRRPTCSLKIISPQARDVDEARRDVSLFRYSVIADLAHLEPHHRGYYRLLQEKARARIHHPRHAAPPRRRSRR
jgi:hypothetical protein